MVSLPGHSCGFLATLSYVADNMYLDEEHLDEEPPDQGEASAEEITNPRQEETAPDWKIDGHEFRVLSHSRSSTRREPGEQNEAWAA